MILKIPTRTTCRKKQQRNDIIVFMDSIN